MYYNSTSETGGKLKEYRSKALGQDKEVLFVFRKNVGRAFSSHEIEDFLEMYPRSSIVRSLNTLENDGLIVKTANKVMGKYGRLVHTYRLANEVGQNNLF
jgi:predicted transcriptional regulator